MSACTARKNDALVGEPVWGFPRWIAHEPLQPLCREKI